MKNMIYFLREAFISLYRNRLLSMATITTMAICIMVLGMAVLLTLNAGSVIDSLESDVEIIAYIEKESSAKQIAAIKKDIEALPGIETITYICKDDALQRLEERLGKDDYRLSETLDHNPLPDSFEIKAVNPHDVPALALQVDKIIGISKVNYGQGVIDRLFQITTGIRTISILFIILLALAAVFLIATTIRLSIYARRKEIYLMKLVGATDRFVSFPFFIEGVLLGTMGGIIAVMILALSYGTFINNVQDTLFFIPLVNDPGFLLHTYIYLVGVSAFLGILGTYISIKRFLNV